jgi:hypothetical protein
MSHQVIEVKWNGVNDKSVDERVVKSKLSKGEAKRLADKLNRKQDLNDGEIISFLVRAAS